ncbi:helix-turn-helix transcriptional regulator [Chitinimonas viridis]|uniref:Helix-turn-helix transcriptional regulator n=1 Tax=Chitinimonas viridis TaxID=664880 RepID=A0ABT8BAU6_9NEIS|nr:helix-turn-helix transcriptional regulator [Chitinimonas viridis]MDN3579165.1 helix-turn-helix transcriptional regulator [Chitinimonas viridis]
MSQTQQLVSALKRALKARGLTYAQVAPHLGLSEASVKRQFSHCSLSLQTLDAICQLAGLELGDLVREMEAAQPQLQHLSEAQEADLVASPKLLLVAVCTLNHWPLTQIVQQYQLTPAEGVAALLQLDKLGLIQLLPENRVKLRVARDFAWLPNGPIHRFFRARIQDDFLDAPFHASGELLRFQHAMLSPAAAVKLQQRLLRLLQEFDELHADCLDQGHLPTQGTSLLLALRSWEPSAFLALRRADTDSR